MNVNIVPKLYDVRPTPTSVHVVVLDSHDEWAEGVRIMITNVAEADRFFAAAHEVRAAMAAILAENLDTAAERAYERAPANFTEAQKMRLVSAAEQAVRDDADIDEVLDAEVEELVASASRAWTASVPVCSSMIPAVAR